MDSYSFDFVFGNEPGIKATVEVFGINADVYSENKVLAIVQLPSDAMNSLKSKAGMKITFEGVLKKLDSFMKNIYVSDGKYSL